MFGLHDIPLPLPAPELVLKTMLVICFILHILFVEMMVGGSILCSLFEWLGIKQNKKSFDLFSLKIAKTITVNKSMAVVLGVGPLLMINVTYTIFFYSSSVLIGNGWIMVIPLTVTAFLLTYLHQYTWSKFEKNKMVHLSFILIATILFLIIPFFFLTNINLMLYPNLWDQIQGFFSALVLPHVFPRYFFFLSTTLTISTFYLIWELNRKSQEEEFNFSETEKNEIEKLLLKITGLGLILQSVFGIVIFLTAPKIGIAKNLIPLTVSTIVFFIPSLFIVIYKGIKNDILSKMQFNFCILTLLVSVFSAGTLRHLFRENALTDYQKSMKENTIQYENKVKAAEKAYGHKDYKYE